MKISQKLRECTGFEWDGNNAEKIWLKHDVMPSECEQTFFKKPFIISHDKRHSQIEDRYYALGRTDTKRLLFVAFTIRNKLVRVISARDMTKKEKIIYSKHEK